MANQNEHLLSDFILYCNAHPEQRFWQALRNWSKYNYIYGSFVSKEDCIDMGDIEDGFEDTFYKEGKQ